VSDRGAIEQTVHHLAAIDRPSASPGEREAAEWIARRLRDAGLEPVLEEEPALGGYWQPLGTLSGLSALAGAAARRRAGRAVRILAGATAVFAAAGIWDDLVVWRHWFRRRVLRLRRTTTNVVAWAGDRDAEETLVVVAHHDAARSGVVFHPAIPATVARFAPGLIERSNTSPPLMWLVFSGPVLVAAGALLALRRVLGLGTLVSAGSAAAFADIASRETVPGPNDNLTGVAVVLDLARALRERPVAGVRVLLVSTGSEESFEEGMQGFARRWFPRLDRKRTRVLVLDTVGSPRLTLPEREGMLVPRPYDAELKDLVSACAADAGVDVGRGLNFSFGSDALIALRAGYRTAMFGSVNAYKAPSNYHWPTDTAQNVDYDRVADAARLVEGVARAIGAQASERSSARAAATAS
jgi:hypothetical protein